MALKYKLDADAFGALDEKQQANYRQEGNVYILDVEGLETDDSGIASMKVKLEQLLTEKKESDRKAREEAEQRARDNEEAAQKNGDYKKLLELEREKREQLENTLKERDERDKQKAVMSEAEKMAASLTRDVGKAKLLAKEIAARLALTDDGLKVTDENGQLTVSSLDELATQVKTSLPFLVDGSQASGGAAQGSKGGAADSSKQVTRSQWDGMNHVDRANFAKEGGKVVDD